MRFQKLNDILYTPGRKFMTSIHRLVQLLDTTCTVQYPAGCTAFADTTLVI